MAKKATKKSSSKRASREHLVVNSKVKACCAAHGMRTGAGFTDALSNEVHNMIKKATKRANSAKRMTLKASDL